MVFYALLYLAIALAVAIRRFSQRDLCSCRFEFRLPGDDKRANCKWGFLLIRKPDTESLVGSVCQDPRELPDGISLIAAEMGGSTSVFIGIRRAV